MKLWPERNTWLGWGGSLERNVELLPRATGPRRDVVLPDFSEVDSGTLSASGHRMRDYQVVASDWLRRRTRGLLGDEMGLGKSCEVLRALGKRARALVVCPAYLRRMWQDQVSEWRGDLRGVLVPYLCEPVPGEVHIVSYDSLPNQERGAREALCPSLNLRGVTLVCDEGHMVKNHLALRTQRVTLLCNQVRQAWVLTGTPLLGSPPDLRGVLKSFGLFQEAYGSDREFVRVFSYSKVGRVTKYGEALPEAREGLARVMLRRLRKDMLDLPPVTYKTIRVEAPEDLRQELDKSYQAWKAWGSLDDLPPFELMSAAMAQLARSRIPAGVTHVRAAMREGPCVVFSAYRDPVFAVGEIPGVRVIVGGMSDREKHEIVEGFQAGNFGCIAGTIDSMGTGITLTRANRVILLDEDWTPAMNEQAISRLLRHGQENPVLVERFLSDHVLDLHRAEILERKMKLISSVVGS